MDDLVEGGKDRMYPCCRDFLGVVQGKHPPSRSQTPWAGSHKVRRASQGVTVLRSTARIQSDLVNPCFFNPYASQSEHTSW